jgi:CBS domain-containing protein
MVISELMTAPVVTADAGESLDQVAGLMRDRNVGSVVVVDRDRPVAMMTDRDVALTVVADRIDASAQVGDHATRPLVTCDADMEVEEAAALMVQNRIRRLPVLDDGQLAGIVTIDDLAVRAEDLQLVQQMTAEVARSALPEFYFHQRGG